MPMIRTSRSAWRSPKTNAAIVPTIGTEATIRAVRPDARCCSAVVSRIHGIAISITPKIATGRQRRSAGRIAPDLPASTNSTTAASDVRPNTTTGGSSCFTATRMRK
jgi:hypothetical protein